MIHDESCEQSVGLTLWPCTQFAHNWAQGHANSLLGTTELNLFFSLCRSVRASSNSLLPTLNGMMSPEGEQPTKLPLS